MTNATWTRHYGNSTVERYETNRAVGEAVAEAFARSVESALTKRDTIAVILATGNSQLTFAESVSKRTDIDWSRITILHMDEYLEMGPDHPASFRRWMHDNIVDKVHPKCFEGVRGDHAPVEEELSRYSALLSSLEPSITVMGIGENGHLAFNDPPADFNTLEKIKVITLSNQSRVQQVNEGHFASLRETPSRAISLTIPALLQSAEVLVGVPESRKAMAVQLALEGPVSPECPASILRERGHPRIFLDKASASQLA